MFVLWNQHGRKVSWFIQTWCDNDALTFHTSAGNDAKYLLKYSAPLNEWSPACTLSCMYSQEYSVWPGPCLGTVIYIDDIAAKSTKPALSQKVTRDPTLFQILTIQQAGISSVDESAILHNRHNHGVVVIMATTWCLPRISNRSNSPRLGLLNCRNFGRVYSH